MTKPSRYIPNVIGSENVRDIDTDEWWVIYYRRLVAYYVGEARLWMHIAMMEAEARERCEELQVEDAMEASER
jgi:hypothetical protein